MLTMTSQSEVADVITDFQSLRQHDLVGKREREGDGDERVVRLETLCVPARMRSEERLSSSQGDRSCLRAHQFGRSF